MDVFASNHFMMMEINNVNNVLINVYNVQH